MLNKKIKPPFIPRVRDQYDTSNFDDEFTVLDPFSQKSDNIESPKGKQFIGKINIKLFVF